MKKELHEFTVDELLGELRRRMTETKPHKVEYASVQGIVLEASDSPLCRRVYKVEYEKDSKKEVGLFRLIGGKFRVDTAPDVGDRVVLRHRLTKRTTEFNPMIAVIVPLQEEGGER